MSRTDRASLLLHVSEHEVFSALTSRDALLVWLPPAGMHGAFERFDMREGGSYRLVLTYENATDAPGKTSADSDVSEVRVTQIVPDELVVQEVDFVSDDAAFDATMRMEWRVRGVDGGTEVELTARNVPAGVRARDHAQGLTSSLANLAAYLEP